MARRKWYRWFPPSLCHNAQAFGLYSFMRRGTNCAANTSAVIAEVAQVVREPDTLAAQVLRSAKDSTEFDVW